MKNIFDYLKERKHISFEEEPFNEVDGLVLSELIYTNFNNICDKDTNLDITEVNTKFWIQHDENEILASSSYTKMAPFLMKEMAGSVRYKGTRVKNYVSEISLEAVKQFAAITFSLPDGSDFIAYRGTDGTVTGWMEDFKFSYTTTDGQKMAIDYLNRYQHNFSRPIRIGGHSKGGNLAVYAATFCHKEIQDRIECIFSYDGPGFKLDVLESDEYKRILSRVVSVVPKESIIGSMMNNQYKSIVTNSDAFSIYQHDAFRWHIEDNHFEELPNRSEFSLFFEKVVSNWLLRFNEDKRREILEALLSLIIENEIVEMDGTKLSPGFFCNLILNTTKLTAADKALLLTSISDVIISASAVTADEIKDKATTAVLDVILDAIKQRK